jgi:hypothetical protein
MMANFKPFVVPLSLLLLVLGLVAFSAGRLVRAVLPRVAPPATAADPSELTPPGSPAPTVEAPPEVAAPQATALPLDDAEATSTAEPTPVSLSLWIIRVLPGTPGMLEICRQHCKPIGPTERCVRLFVDHNGLDWNQGEPVIYPDQELEVPPDCRE